MEKYLSIITNFGCHFECPYCITKNGHIGIKKTTIESLDLLEKYIDEVEPNIVSISGGGDPLYDFDSHKDYYIKLFGICAMRGLPIEVHTSCIKSNFPYSACKRVVYHVHSFEQLAQIKRHGTEIVRAVFVVTDSFTEEDILKIKDYHLYHLGTINELSFRQLVDGNFSPSFHLHDLLVTGHKKGWWHYIEQGDYNTYFANGKLYTKFTDLQGDIQ